MATEPTAADRPALEISVTLTTGRLCRFAVDDSAAAGQAFKPGPMDSPGLGQLAYYERMRILSASAANAVAKEYPDLGHGLLTAALMQDGLVQGLARPAAGQSLLTIGPWLTFAEADVPRLDAQENGRTANRTLPGHKEIVLVDGAPEAREKNLQRPSLFDFHRAAAPDAADSISTAKVP